MASLEEVMKEAGAEAGQILMSHFGKLSGYEKKDEINLVTVADREAEAAIIARIRHSFPDHAILAEESGPSAVQQTHYRWIIDPLDGTTNFAHSVPIFAVSIAVEYFGNVIHGLVHQPVTGETFFAARGQGAFLGDKPLRVSQTPTLAQSLLVTGFPYDRRERTEHYMELFARMLKRSHGVLRLGAAALDFCSVACGMLEGYWEENLYPWDVAAGALIVEEAGGAVSDFSGNPFSPYAKQFLASNGHIHEELIGVLSSSQIPDEPR